MKHRLIIAQVKIEFKDDTDYGSANLETNSKLIVLDYIRRFNQGVIDIKIDEVKDV